MKSPGCEARQGTSILTTATDFIRKNRFELLRDPKPYDESLIFFIGKKTPV
jgi:hypothetical protein